jgi:hypothetical protein
MQSQDEIARLKKDLAAAQTAATEAKAAAAAVRGQKSLSLSRL